MTSEFEFTSRYGENLPDPETMCRGHCEGMGFYPVWFAVPGTLIRVEGIYTPEELDLWTAEHKRAHGVVALLRLLRSSRSLSEVRFAFREAFHCDGWHFVPCRCQGTGRRS